MIGQIKNKQLLMQWRMNRSVPRFIIIEGAEGSGRLELSKLILKITNSTGIITDNSISVIRDIIAEAYTITSSTTYIFRDCDDMSVPAKNSLLKVVEEPPNNARFIMTVNSLSNMLDTIKSRATIIKMNPYTYNELRSFTQDELILKYVTMPYQAKTLDMSKIQACEQCVQEVISSILNCSGVGILKETTKLKAKESDDDKIDCVLFLKVFEKNVSNELLMSDVNLMHHIELCKNDMRRNSINKKASIECMLLRILNDMKEKKNASIS